MTNKHSELGVIGWPLHTTFSPPMQQAALDAAGLGYSYARIPVAPEALDSFIAAASRTMVGLNVTTPHKHAVWARCTRTDDLGRICEAVNTVVFRQCEIHGYNTDGPGLQKALNERAGFEAAGRSALVLGAGGAARGALAELAKDGIEHITMANRTERNARDLCARIGRFFPAVKWDTVGLDRLDAGGFDLLLNTVPAEHTPPLFGVLETLSRDAVFMDLNYGPTATEFEQRAANLGLNSVPGLEMLLWQGVLAFEIFTAVPAPVESMRKALTRLAGKWWLRC